MTRRLSAVVAAAALAAGVVAVIQAQTPTPATQPPPATQQRAAAPEPWRRSGPRPCVRPGSGFSQCAAPLGVTAVRAG